MTSDISIGVCGMSHLGLNYLAAFAAKGFKVTGFDIDREKIDDLMLGKLRVDEPSLAENIFKENLPISFSSDFEKLSDCNVVFCSIDITTDADGNSDLAELKSLISLIKRFIANETSLVILSQVNPGFTRSIKNAPKNLYYQVETLVFGEAFERALNPERIIVGKATLSEELEGNYAAILQKFHCEIFELNYESAELAKISINLFLTSSVTLANTLSGLCESIGADWGTIAPILRSDKRIGKYSYVNAGLGISGGNLERDIKTASKLLKKQKLDNSLMGQFEKRSSFQKKWPLNVLQNDDVNFHEAIKVAVLGLTYKENTNSIKNSPSIELIRNLDIQTEVQIYDPKADFVNLGQNLIRVDDPINAVTQSEITFCMVPWSEIIQLSLSHILNLMKGNVIVDPFGIFASEAGNITQPLRYYRIGCQPLVYV